MEPGHAEPRPAGLYDVLNPWAASDESYLGHVLRSPSALDAGCGTGELLCRARAAGFGGDLAGADPSPAMLAVARAKRPDVSWVLADAASLDLGRTFGLVTMTGHAFQELRSDAATLAALAAFRRHRGPGGRLAFETRNPAARAWERWGATPPRAVTGPDGAAWEVSFAATALRPPDLVDYVATYRAVATGETIASPGTLRFVDPGRLRALLAEAGFRVEAWHGDWDGSPVGPASPEVIVVATPA